ncbi:hypothetical protein Peur_041620 [Populus x canadensis]
MEEDRSPGLTRAFTRNSLYCPPINAQYFALIVVLIHDFQLKYIVIQKVAILCPHGTEDTRLLLTLLSFKMPRGLAT